MVLVDAIYKWPTDESGCRWGKTLFKVSRELTLEGTLAAQASQDESLCWGVNPLANHSTYQCVYHDQLYFAELRMEGRHMSAFLHQLL